MKSIDDKCFELMEELVAMESINDVIIDTLYTMTEKANLAPEKNALLFGIINILELQNKNCVKISNDLESMATIDQVPTNN
jgi:hypothetical protein